VPVDGPWYRTHFERFYHDVWFAEQGTPDEHAAEAQDEADAIDRLLALPSGAAILDLACGHGRHAIELARHGYLVTGLDLSAHHIALARSAAESAGVEVTWIHADMRELPSGPFDAIINVCTAFGYLETEAEDQKILDAACHCLRPGGRFLLDVLSRDIVRNFRPLRWYPLQDGGYFLQRTSFDLMTGLWQGDNIRVRPDGRSESQAFNIRLYTLTELARMLAAAGMTLKGTWGSLDGQEFTLDSPRLVLLAERT
jgi:SAM-dependent methyltransferase